MREQVIFVYPAAGPGSGGQGVSVDRLVHGLDNARRHDSGNHGRNSIEAHSRGLPVVEPKGVPAPNSPATARGTAHPAVPTRMRRADMSLSCASAGTLTTSDVTMRVLEGREIYPLGSAPRGAILPVAACNRDVRAEVRAGRFRADLFYRISVTSLRVPALRERCDDLPLLVEHFARYHEMRMLGPTAKRVRLVIEVIVIGGLAELAAVQIGIGGFARLFGAPVPEHRREPRRRHRRARLSHSPQQTRWVSRTFLRAAHQMPRRF